MAPNNTSSRPKYPGHADGPLVLRVRQPQRGIHQAVFILSGTEHQRFPVVSGAAALLLQAKVSVADAGREARLMKTATKTFALLQQRPQRIHNMTYNNIFRHLQRSRARPGERGTAALANSDTRSRGARHLAGSTVMNSNGQVTLMLAGSVIMGAGIWYRGTNIVWGTTSIWGTNIVWGTSLFTGEGLDPCQRSVGRKRGLMGERHLHPAGASTLPSSLLTPFAANNRDPETQSACKDDSQTPEVTLCQLTQKSTYLW